MLLWQGSYRKRCIKIRAQDLGAMLWERMACEHLLDGLQRHWLRPTRAGDPTMMIVLRTLPSSNNYVGGEIKVSAAMVPDTCGSDHCRPSRRSLLAVGLGR